MVLSLTALQLLWIAPVLLVASFIQGAVGFAFGLFAVPALALVGLPLHHAVALAVGSTLIQTAWSCRQLREHVLWRETGRVVAVRCAFMGAGVWLLAHRLAPDPTLAKQLLGAVLLALVTVMWLVSVRPTQRPHPIWGAIAFPLSGLLGGMFGMGGPPLVLWASAHDWTSHRLRAFLLANFLAASPIQIAMLIAAFGRPAVECALLGAAFGPFIVLGAQLGLNAGHRLSPTRLRTVALGLLVVIAINAIIAPLL